MSTYGSTRSSRSMSTAGYGGSYTDNSGRCSSRLGPSTSYGVIPRRGNTGLHPSSFTVEQTTTTTVRATFDGATHERVRVRIAEPGFDMPAPAGYGALQYGGSSRSRASTQSISTLRAPSQYGDSTRVSASLSQYGGSTRSSQATSQYGASTRSSQAPSHYGGTRHSSRAESQYGGSRRSQQTVNQLPGYGAYQPSERSVSSRATGRSRAESTAGRSVASSRRTEELPIANFVTKQDRTVRAARAAQRIGIPGYYFGGRGDTSSSRQPERGEGV